LSAAAARVLRRPALPFKGDLLSRIGAAILVFFVLVAVSGLFLPIGESDAIGTGPRLASPSAEFPAGTDTLGRDVLPRIVEGLRITFLLASIAVLLTAVVSIALAMIAAYYRGVIGELIARGADVFFAFPAILLGILVAVIVGPGSTAAVISIALICCPLMIRVVRASALTVADREFVTAAKVGGARPGRILLVHILPNIAGSAVVQATYVLSIAMLLESALSFLGLGVQPPQASLGSLVREGVVYLSVAPWLVLIPGVILALAIMSVNLVGDGLRDVLDVRGSETRGR
jgi:peptide/nickel transport system permease protein